MDRPWHFAVTATTRPPRPSEQYGLNYIFLEPGKFLAMKQRQEFLESAEVYGRWYGVPRSQVAKGLEAGKDVILKTDVQGAGTIRRLVPQGVFIFMLPASWQELRERLSTRKTETDAEVELRLDIARSEAARVNEFEYRVVNRDGGLAQTVAAIDGIISAEKNRVKPRDPVVI
jgi:guanylate kinase